MSLVLTIAVFAVGVSGTAFSQSEATSAQSKGQDIFAHKCATCHGGNGAGTPVGKSLKVADLRSALTQKKSDVDLSHVVSDGKNSMPAFGNDLSPDEVQAVVSYVHTLKTKKK